MGNVIKGPWSDVDPGLPPQGVSESEAALEPLAHAYAINPLFFEFIEGRELFDQAATVEEALPFIQNRMEAMGIVCTDLEVQRWRSILERLFYKYAQMKPWREKLKTKEGVKEFIDIVGKGKIDSGDVIVDLSHPIFVGVLFKDFERCRRFRMSRLNRIDDVVGWVTLSAEFPEYPALNFAYYFGTLEIGGRVSSHEVQHLLYASAYDPRIRKAPLGTYSRLDQIDTVEEVEYNLFLNELLAHLKSNEWPSKVGIFNGWLDGLFERLSFDDIKMLGEKYHFLDVVLGDRVRVLKVEPRDLWKYVQSAGSLDEALWILFERLYSEKERKEWMDRNGGGEVEDMRSQFGEYICSFVRKDALVESKQFYEAEIKFFSPQWWSDFEALATSNGWDEGRRMREFCFRKDRISHVIAKWIRYMRGENASLTDKWLEEMVIAYPFFDQRLDVMEMLAFDIYTVGLVDRMGPRDFSAYTKTSLLSWREMVVNARQNIVSDYTHVPFQECRVKLRQSLDAAQREIEKLIEGTRFRVVEE